MMELSSPTQINLDFYSDIDLRIRNIPFNKVSDALKVSSEEPEGLKKAAKGFEEFFVQFLLSQMRKTVPKNGFLGKSRSTEIFTSMLDEQIAKECARRGNFGIADLIEERMKEEFPERFSEDKNQNQGDTLLREKVTGEKLFLQFFIDPVGIREGYFNDTEGFATPLRGELTSGFGMRNDPITGERAMHYGIDVAAPEGTPVRAIKSGKVIFSGFKKGYGNVVMIKHVDNLISTYAHNSSNIVKSGDEVKKGQVISRVGNTGRSTGPHLHLELNKDGKYIDPLTFFPFLRR